MRDEPSALRKDQLLPLPGERLFTGLAIAFGLLAIAGVAGARVLFGVRLRDSTVDPVTLAELPAWTGWFSNLGIVVWIAGAACALFAAAVLPGGETRRFLLAIGAFTAWLGLDDLYWVHEAVGRALLGGERGEDIVFALYAVVVLVILWRFRRLVFRETPAGVLVAAGLLFSMSILFDRPGVERTGHFLVEDGSKFAGIVMLAAYLALTARRFVCASAAADARPQARQRRRR